MRLHNCLFIIIFFVVGCKTNNPLQPDNPKYSGEIEKHIKHVINYLKVETPVEGIYETKTLAEQMKYYHTPGLSIAVIYDGKIEWARGFGIRNEKNDPVDVHTLFQAGSVSKPVFALAVMRLKEQGKVDLDENVNEYLHTWKIHAQNDWTPVISFRKLLSHTAGMTVHGFPGYLKTEPVPTLPQILDGKYPANTPAVRVNILPGSVFNYSGGGVTIAQLAVMDIMEKPFPEIMIEELFKPLGLKYSTYTQPLPDSLESLASTAYPYKGQPVAGRFHVYPEMAAAGLWSNPTELASIVMEVQKALKGGSSVFKKETIEEMLTPQKVAPGIGIGFFLESKSDSVRFGHSGWDEGFVTAALAYKNRNMGAVIMVNSNEGNSLLDEIMRSIAAEYQWPGFLPVPKGDSPITPGEMKTFPGTYSDNHGSDLKINLNNGNFYLNYQTQGPIKIIKADNGSYYNPALNFNITYDKNELRFTQMNETKVFKRK